MRVLRNPHETPRGTWQVFEVHWTELRDDLSGGQEAVCIAAQSVTESLVVCRVQGRDTLEVADRRVRAYINQATAYNLKPGVFTVLEPS